MKPWLFSMGAIILFLLLSYAALTWLLPIILPFVLASLLAEILAPAVDWLAGTYVKHRRWRLPRGLASALLVVLLTTGLATGVTLGVARIIREVQGLAADFPQHYLALQLLAGDLAERVGAFSATLPASVQGMLNQALVQLKDKVGTLLQNLPSVLSAALVLPAMMTNAIVMMVATFFILRDRRTFGQFLINLLPQAWHPALREVKHTIWISAMGLAKAVLVLITITGILTMLGLSLIGAPYALTMGLVVAFADLLPILGPGAVFLPWAAYHLATGGTFFGIKLLVLYGVLTVIRQVLEAKLLGDHTGLHPLTTLFSMYVGFYFFGGLGFLFGPLLAIALKAMVQSGLLPMVNVPPRPRKGVPQPPQS